MQPNAVKTATARLAASFFAILALAVPTVAGDGAGINYLGYSPDGRYFAFEEFGIQDGSGFAYATIHILDLSADSWVKGAPIRVRTEDEAEPLAAVRDDAKAQARTLLDQYSIDEPVDILALNGDGAVGADFGRLTFGTPGYAMSEPGNVGEVTLDTFPLTGQTPCGDYTEQPTLGFALTVTQDAAPAEVHRDTRLPTSRGCPLGYRLYGIIAPFDSFAAFNPEPLATAVAIVSVYTLGFEGPDRRFIAVPLGH